MIDGSVGRVAWQPAVHKGLKKHSRLNHILNDNKQSFGIVIVEIHANDVPVVVHVQ